VTSYVEKSRATSRYAYDALGRRTVSQDAGGIPLRTRYDGFSFEVIREGETFTGGSFTTRYSEGIQRQHNSGTEGSRSARLPIPARVSFRYAPSRLPASASLISL
jgi:YD repeat-containing protein